MCGYNLFHKMNPEAAQRHWEQGNPGRAYPYARPAANGSISASNLTQAAPVLGSNVNGLQALPVSNAPATKAPQSLGSSFVPQGYAPVLKESKQASAMRVIR